ncbi:MAG: AMP-binding protein, partial [Eubacteriales bacterium]|nr:AMP-binding protein [Eubacteriales bacterium]
MSPRTLLWRPSKERVEQSRMLAFMRRLEKRHGLNISGYRALHQWSVEKPEVFWDELWQFLGIRSTENYTSVVDDLTKFPGAKWFPGAVLNYAENILKDHNDREIALIFRGENHMRRSFTWAALRNQVERLATRMREEGIVPGDRVAAYMPNVPETVIAMLASSAVGAIWSSCATDVGVTAAIDRLGQIEPKLLFTADGYTYKGKPFDVTEKAAEIVKGIPSITRVVLCHYAGDMNKSDGIPHRIHWEDYLAKEKCEPFVYEPLPASHPLVIMFSSGTTGKPKCMAQSQAGLLVNQL